MIAGVAGAAVPQIMSLVVVIFLGWLLIVAGILSAYIVFLSRGRSMIAWLKPVLLVLIGVLFLYDPTAGAATLALLLTIYLLLVTHLAAWASLMTFIRIGVGAGFPQWSLVAHSCGRSHFWVASRITGPCWNFSRSLSGF